MDEEMSMSLDEIIQKRNDENKRIAAVRPLIISRKFRFGDNGVLKKRFINRYGFTTSGRDIGFINVPLNQRTFPLGTPKNKLNLVKKANAFKTHPNGVLKVKTRPMQTPAQRAQISQVLKERSFQLWKKTPVFARQNLYQRILAKKKVANAIRNLNLQRRQENAADSDLTVTIANDFRRKRFGNGSAALSRQNLARFNAAFGNKQTSRTVTPEGSIITTISQSVRGGRRQPSVTGSNRSFRGGTFAYRGINRQSRPRSRNDFDNRGSRSGSMNRASRSGSMDRTSHSGSMNRFLSNERQRSRSHSRQRSLSRGRAPSFSRQTEIEDEEDLEQIELTEEDLENLQAVQSRPFNTLYPGRDQNGRQIVTFRMNAAYTQVNINDRFTGYLG